MKARSRRVKILSETDAATLESSVNTWLEAAGEKEWVSISFKADGTSVYAFIVYTE